MKSFKEIILESIEISEETNEKFKNFQKWKKAAEKRNFEVVMPPRLKNGDKNDNEWFLARAEKGNTMGEFHVKGRMVTGGFLQK